MKRNYLSDKINSLKYKLKNKMISKADYYHRIQKLKAKSRNNDIRYAV